MVHRYFIVLCLSVICATAALAEDVVVVVNQKNSVTKLSRDEVIDVFMGRNRLLSSGVTAMPLDLPSTAVERADFYFRLTGKSMSQINAYWARLILTGRASPPTLMHSQEEAMQTITENRSAVGYVNRNKTSSQVKTVFELNEK
jgi:ABC-type phosphate transport system substrate-binding protein